MQNTNVDFSRIRTRTVGVEVEHDDHKTKDDPIFSNALIRVIDRFNHAFASLFGIYNIYSGRDIDGQCQHKDHRDVRQMK